MIYKKLLAFQSQNITIIKSATNPHFRSSYATLNEVLEKVKAPLNEIGVVILQCPGTDPDTKSPGLWTYLVDTEDNSRVEAFFPYAGAGNAQQLGSANTYARRYSLVTLLGLEDEDDDGNLATAPSAAPKPAQRPVNRAAETAQEEEVLDFELDHLSY